MPKSGKKSGRESDDGKSDHNHHDDRKTDNQPFVKRFRQNISAALSSIESFHRHYAIMFLVPVQMVDCRHDWVVDGVSAVLFMAGGLDRWACVSKNT